MDKYIQQIRESEFLRYNAIFFVGNVAMGALNYIYYPLLGRLMQPSAFGEVQTLVSLFIQISIFLTVLGMLTVNIVANFGDKPEAQRTILELEKLALLISVVGFIITVALAPMLQRFFRFDNAPPFIVLALSIVVSVPATFRMSYLRGKQLFGLTSIAGLIGAGSKLLFSAALIVMGFGTTGAILGLVLAQILSFGYAAIKARKHGFHQSLLSGLLRPPDMKLILPELRYALLVLIGSLVITVLYSIDIIAVKHYSDAHTAGLYAGIATVARIIFFLTGSIAQVLLPAVRLTQTPHQNRQVLFKSIYLTAAIGGAALMVFWFMPRLVIKLLMGSAYLQFASLLPKLSLALFIISLLNLILLYFMALRRYSVSIIAILGVAVTGGLIGIHHSTPVAVVDSLLYGSLSMSGLLMMWVGLSKLRQQHIR